MFRGIHTLTIDPKGRVAIPSKCRQKLRDTGGDELITTLHFLGHCLLLYPLPEWERIERKLIDLPALDPTTDQLKKMLMGYAGECVPDGQGRILLPPLLREQVGLDKRALLVGQGNKYEIWNEQAWAEQRTQWLQQVGSGAVELPEALKSLSL